MKQWTRPCYCCYSPIYTMHYDKQIAEVKGTAGYSQ
jgi:hypothetical protein